LKKRKNENFEEWKATECSPAIESNDSIHPPEDSEWLTLDLELKWKGSMCSVHGNWPQLGRMTKLLWLRMQCISNEGSKIPLEIKDFLVHRFSGHKSELPEISEERKIETKKCAKKSKILELEERIKKLEDLVATLTNKESHDNNRIS